MNLERVCVCVCRDNDGHPLGNVPFHSLHHIGTRNRRARADLKAPPPVSVWTLTQVMQQFLGSVLGGLEVEELLVLVDELGVHGGVKELVVGQHVLQEWDVGLEGETQVERRKLELGLMDMNTHIHTL